MSKYKECKPNVAANEDTHFESILCLPQLLASVSCQEPEVEDESQLLYLVDQSADEFGLKDVTQRNPVEEAEESLQRGLD